MNVEDCTRLCKLIESVSPAQRFTDLTPAVWAPLLANVAPADALAAVQALASRQPFIAPAEILAEVGRIRDERQDRVTAPLPNVDPDDVVGWAAEERALVRAIRDGEMGETGARLYERSGAVLTAGARPRVVGPLRDRRREMEAGVGCLLDKAL